MHIAHLVLIDEAFELGLESFVLGMSHLHKIRAGWRNIQFVVLHVGPPVATPLLPFHAAFDFPNRALELLREFLPFLLLVLGEFFALILLTVSTARSEISRGGFVMYLDALVFLLQFPTQRFQLELHTNGLLNLRP